MAAVNNVSGSCLCGEVKVEVAVASASVGACHCDMCRKWASGPFFAVDCGTEVHFSGQEHISVYDSSKWAERGFCRQCGSHLFYKLKQSGQYMLPAGLLDKTLNLNFDHQVFIDEKPEYYTFANQTQNMTGEELFAQFAES